MACLRCLPWIGVFQACFVLAVSFKQDYQEARRMERNGQDKSLLLQRVLPEEVWQFFAKKLHPSSIESFSPPVYLNQRNETRRLNQFQLLKPQRNVTSNKYMKNKRKFHTKMKNYEIKTLIPEEKRHCRSLVQEKTDFYRQRRQTSADNIKNMFKNSTVLTKIKRFKSPGVASLDLPDISRTPSWTQFLKYNAPWKNNLAPENNSRKGHDYSKENAAGKFSFVTKREMTNALSEIKRVRKKRFIFAEAAENPPPPSLFSIMMGTALDPNTGKRIEFGGDIMRDMIVNAFIPFLPPSAQPAPGKEPGELVQMMAPVWFFNRLQGSMIPRGNIPPRNMNQKRDQHGYYGDTMQGRGKR